MMGWLVLLGRFVQQGQFVQQGPCVLFFYQAVGQPAWRREPDASSVPAVQSRPPVLPRVD